MGTADKLGVAALGVYDQSIRLGIPLKQVDFVLIELGFGYNAVMAVEGGKVIDGLGGTSSLVGFLTSGPLDAEVVTAGRSWERIDVFHGGLRDLCMLPSLEEMFKSAASGSKACRIGIKAFLEGLVKAVAAMLQSFNGEPRKILISGRYSRIGSIYGMVREALKIFGIPVRRVGFLKGAKEAKEAAQGYAIIAEGLNGGYFKDLVKRMRVDRACGTVMDWVYHPRLRLAKEKLREAYIGSVINPKLCKNDVLTLQSHTY